jgi:peptidoglycan/xylan/chitin deacetylase (PgdA/CDA1 family)
MSALADRPVTAPDRPSSSTLALMYHAVGEAAGDMADAHYRVGCEELRQHLTACAAHGPLTSARSWLAGGDGTILTFDDGDASHYAEALPLLLARHAQADFFVNPASVGQRGYVTWGQLREMAELGMSIQSHGYEHRYLTALSPQELERSLVRARLTIEQQIGEPVQLLAPPGGRMPADLRAIARDCGYSHVLCSRPGRVRRDAANAALPRLAVVATLQPAVLQRWLEGQGLLRLRLRYAALDLAKRTVGDRTYESLRRRWLAAATERSC